MSDVDEELITVLQDIRRWVKLIGLEDAREKVHEAISHSDDVKEVENKIMFHLTDGNRSTKEIEDYVSVTYKTVSERQQEWAKAGLMEKPAPNLPYRKLVSLEEAGINVPDIPEAAEDD